MKVSPGRAGPDPVRQHARAAGDGAAVAARLADDSALSGVMTDSSIDATPDSPSPDGSPGCNHDVAGSQRAVDDLDAAVGQLAPRRHVGLARARRLGLPRASAIASAKLANSTVTGQSAIWTPKSAPPFRPGYRGGRRPWSAPRRLRRRHHRVAGERHRVELADASSSDQGGRARASLVGAAMSTRRSIPLDSAARTRA